MTDVHVVESVADVVEVVADISTRIKNTSDALDVLVQQVVEVGNIFAQLCRSAVVSLFEQPAPDELSSTCRCAGAR